MKCLERQFGTIKYHCFNCYFSSSDPLTAGELELYIMRLNAVTKRNAVCNENEDINTLFQFEVKYSVKGLLLVFQK